MNIPDRVIELRDVAVGYDEHPVASGLDIDLAPGEMLALIGTNGAGKSTLIRSLVGLLEPISGSMTVLGTAPGGAPSRLAYMGQFHSGGSVLPIRVRDLVAMGRFANLGLFGRFGPSDRALVDQSLMRMGISDLADRPVRDLSGGQRQRAFLAQVLARCADLIVLDEPTAGIDAAGRSIYDRVLAEERDRGAAVVVSTHDIDEAARATKVMLMSDELILVGDPETVLTPENLLRAFGVDVKRFGTAVIATEQAHAHDHEH